MLCRNFGEALNFLAVVTVIILVLTGVTIACSLGWLDWDWITPGIALVTLLIISLLGLIALLLSPMR